MRLAPAALCQAALHLAAMPACAQTTDPSRPPTLTVERYDEDWSVLADPERRTGRWTEKAKYIALDNSGSDYLTTGLEARSRYEGYENTNWGSAPDQGYVWHRLMPYADLHLGGFRVFAQPILSAISGGDAPRRPVDTTGADISQAFAEAALELPGDTRLSVAAGRRLVSLGAGRFIDDRYGPGVPLPFDGVSTTATGRRAQLTLLYLRPVDTIPGDFNDHTSRQRATWGAYGTRWLDDGHRVGFDLFYLGYRDRRAVFDQGTGREIAHTFGTRVFGDTGAWFWNLEGVIQRGRFVRRPVRAWGIGGEIGRRFPHAPLMPELTLTTDVASGDHDPDDGSLQTLNPLFPRGKYFGALTPVGPRNLIHLRPSVAIHPMRAVAVSLTGVAYWRESRRDGIYNIPGFLVRSGQDASARFIGKQAEFGIAWQATPELNLSAQLSAFVPGGFIRETGPARVIRMAGAAANFRF
ncbi:alginate export family protein [Sphingomonas sp. DT-51]|uniref:alginate export family protein n=1 Tax=Sphingomonas sp. DT-51 TaxID=3396165 RepID=UPI003F1AA2F9